MKELLQELKAEYEQKFESYCRIAEISLAAKDEVTFREMMRKAAGCNMMIEEYERQLSNYN